MPKKITKKEFQLKINQLFPDEEIEILDYSKASSPLTYKCNICNNIFNISQAKLLYRKKHCCNNCFSLKNKGEITEQLKEKALKIIESNKNLAFVDFGYNSKIFKPTIKIKCLKCGQTFEKQLNFFVTKNSKCSYCETNRLMNTKSFKGLLPEGYTMLEDYCGIDNKILFRHEECGFIWKTTPHNLRSGHGCPKCAKGRSKGEKKIIDFLQKNFISFESEKIFEWSNLRRYDFYLPDFNLLIEYNGIQHYKDIIFHGERRLEKIKEVDKQKKEMALLHKFNFLEISYENFDKIEEILAQRLSVMSVAE